MKRIFWNARGLAKSPTRLALKRLIIKHKPDIILLAEPFIPFSSFPPLWFHRLGLKLLAINQRDDLLPNLWCFCASHLNPTIVDIDNQQISFTISENNTIFDFNAVYASTNYITRRQLWHKLQTIQNQHNLPWCAIGDFSTIIGSHEYRGSFIPARVPMEDFFNWSDNNNLIHIPTRGVQYTWSNGRSGARHTEKRLDRAICNQQWLDNCTSLSVTTLTKHKSDHFPILLDFHTSIVTFASQFRFMKMWTLHEDCINVVSNSWNSSVLGCPMFVLSKKLSILKQNLKSWNHNVFGNVHFLVKEAEANLENIQNQIDSARLTDDLLEQQKAAHISLEKTLEKEEAFWQERAKVQWHLEGDRNTSYFHRIAKIKNKTKPILSI